MGNYMTLINSILINPQEQSISEIQIDTSKSGICDILNCRYFSSGHYFENEDTLYVDDEGIYVESNKCFVIDGSCNPLFGLGIVLGATDQGDSSDVKSNIDEIKNKIVFLNRSQAAIFSNLDTSCKYELFRRVLGYSNLEVIPN